MIRVAVLSVALLMGAAFVPIAADAAPAPATTFKVAGRTIVGTPKMNCVLEGKWADGSRFRYEAWDACSRIKVRRVTEQDARRNGEPIEGDFADIPPGAELVEVSNAYSTVVLYLDRDGEMKELTTAD